ncbi:hypothetical protein GLOTRDRAFT_93556 [Gloeophyllum trabeum ATCC 11539]|uniref:Uncharacterized protein n=1 Tax=Gloeophyllum trabeum (strain ATCC 11539 / FP-39264 / Madison 617) TaxID=670483 RepID=S7RPZ5_GLOTA|nr:uncharacterized protein GLOTRDRAFT_93556 [Gloeophyllum trabeum ATCC 11539]EPQ54959.1 hypothetical protein GLOTRDRAFT_93556 [Gloeophyllum trabeum ATCC 11539]
MPMGDHAAMVTTALTAQSRSAQLQKKREWRGRRQLHRGTEHDDAVLAAWPSTGIGTQYHTLAVFRLGGNYDGSEENRTALADASPEPELREESLDWRGGAKNKQYVGGGSRMGIDEVDMRRLRLDEDSGGEKEIHSRKGTDVPADKNASPDARDGGEGFEREQYERTGWMQASEHESSELDSVAVAGLQGEKFTGEESARRLRYSTPTRTKARAKLKGIAHVKLWLWYSTRSVIYPRHSPETVDTHSTRLSQSDA